MKGGMDMKSLGGGLVMAMCLAPCVLAAAQKNGAVWYDTVGHVVNAHGGGVLAHGGRYYLYGEHKVYGEAGNKAHNTNTPSFKLPLSICR